MLQRIAHLSDIHLSCPGPTFLRMWTSKRILGGTNMLLFRRREYRNAALPLILSHLEEQNPDLVVVSGDLSTTALSHEFALAQNYLQPFIKAGRLMTIPGNHDIYTQREQRSRLYERFFGTCHGDHGQEAYPFVRTLGDDVALIGVNTCLATGFFQAWGEVSTEQLEALPALLDAHRERYRIVVLHHYLQDRHGAPGHRRRWLRNREQVLDILAEHGADMVLHGHDHARYEYTVPGPEGSEISVYNPGPTTRHSHMPERRGGYQIYHVEDKQLLQIERFCFDPESGHCVKRA